MHTATFLAGLLAVVELVAATPVKARTAYAVKESHPIPKRWARVARAPSDHIIDLQIGLTQHQYHELERHLYEVSDPYHSRYGQHLSQDEVIELVRPSEEAHSLVHEWLADNGLESHRFEYSPAQDWISVSLTVDEIERLLDTEYAVYEHEDGTSVVRTPSWSLPQHLHQHIDTIQPTNSFFRVKAQARKIKPVSQLDLEAVTNLPQIPDSEATVPKVCNPSLVTPQCLRTYYNTINYTPKATDKNTVALCDYDGESNNRSDVSLFLSQYRPEAKKAAYDFKVVVINNGNNEQTQETPKQLAAGKDLEGNLDAETILGIDYPTPLVAFTTGGKPPFKPDKSTPTDSSEPYLQWQNALLKLSSIPQTISTSYGDDEQTVPFSYATRVCNQFVQLGARGVTVLYASGDSGVGPTGDCVSNDRKNTRMFIPGFPTTCPYVTAVGATKDFSPEVAAFDAANGFASGGGFSNYFAVPSYQQKTVNAYVKSLNGLYNGLYNKSGRAYPDISAQGQRFATIWNGSIAILDGTSASTPTATAVIALVNDALIATGKAPLGFLNPFIYAYGEQAFHDIVSGSAIGCGVKGFPAQKGWDAVTGFGTPKFLNLKAAAFKAAKAAKYSGR